jgi:hypothetical protein
LSAAHSAELGCSKPWLSQDPAVTSENPSSTVRVLGNAVGEDGRDIVLTLLVRADVGAMAREVVGTAVRDAVGECVFPSFEVGAVGIFCWGCCVLVSEVKVGASVVGAAVAAAVGDTMGTFVSPTFVAEAVGASVRFLPSKVHQITFRLSIAMSP